MMPRGWPMLLLLSACAGAPPTGPREHDTGSRLRVAAAAEAAGRSDMALSMYGSAAAADPGNAAVQAGFAAALLRAGNAAQAEQVLQRALQRHPADAGLLVASGRLRLRSGAAEGALADFTWALAAAPRNPQALGGMAVALDLLGRHGEAEGRHRAALALAPGNIGIANNLGMSLLLAGRAAEAAEVFAALAALPAAPPRVAANLGLARAAAQGMAGEAGAAPLLAALAQPPG
jgi:Flp pilus assembly protein TadD